MSSRNLINVGIKSFVSLANFYLPALSIIQILMLKYFGIMVHLPTSLCNSASFDTEFCYVALYIYISIFSLRYIYTVRYM